MFFPTSSWTLRKLTPHLQLVSWALGTRPKKKIRHRPWLSFTSLRLKPPGSQWLGLIQVWCYQEVCDTGFGAPGLQWCFILHDHSIIFALLALLARFDGRFDHFCLYQNHFEWLSDGVAHNNRNSSLKVLDWPGPFPGRPSHFGAHLRQVDNGWHKAPMNHCLI